MRLLHLLAPLFFLSYPLFAENGGCFRFFPDSFRVVDSIPAYAVAKNRFVSIGCPDGKKIVSHDRFTGLCIFEENASRPLYMSDAKPPLYLCPDKKRADKAIRSYPVSVFPGKVAVDTEHGGAIFSGCCKLAGIFGKGGIWFDASSIKRILGGKTLHGDIGARFKTENGAVTVEAVDPFSGCDLKPGDRVIKAGRKSRPDLRYLLETIDECKPHDKFRLVVERGGAVHEINASCFERFGGGKISDTFLERFGMEFSSSLRIIHLDSASISYMKGLRVGDKLLMIDGKAVESETDVRALLSGYVIQKSTPGNMLWERDGFQFFLLPTSL